MQPKPPRIYQDLKRNLQEIDSKYVTMCFLCVCFSLDTCKKEKETDGKMMMMIARRPGPTLGRSRDQSQLSPARWWWQLIQPAPIFFVHFATVSCQRQHVLICKLLVRPPPSPPPTARPHCATSAQMCSAQIPQKSVSILRVGCYALINHSPTATPKLTI